MPASPGQHVVVTVKENHGFDNYLGTFVGAKGMAIPCSSNPPSTNPDHRHGAWLTRNTTAVRAQFVEQDISNLHRRVSLRRSIRDFDWHYHLERND